MSTSARPKRVPNHALLTDETAARYARLTQEGRYGLLPTELFWQQRFRFLKDAGYLLRPRYAPEWKPSWMGTNLDPAYCEDSIMPLDYQVMDATRLSNKELVAIKSFLVVAEKQEMQIAQLFASIDDDMNHCVRVYEILSDPFKPHSALMIMPYLRPCNDPDWATLGDVVDFVTQTLEGLAFMQRHNVAHRDISVPNIMMDARSLYPEGHHPIQLGYSRDALNRVSALPRAGRSIKYFYIDFGLSMLFPSGSPPSALGVVGRDKEVPELSDSVPYDPFKVDVFALGNLYSKEFEEKYKGMEFLSPLIERMTRPMPSRRSTSEEAIRQWESIRPDVPRSSFRWRLSPKTEPALERVLNDTVAVAWEGIYTLKKFVG